jgi:hypothetical protein
MDGGSVLEIGTHAELLQARGAYAALYRLQFREQSAPFLAHAGSADGTD